MCTVPMANHYKAWTYAYCVKGVDNCVTVAGWFSFRQLPAFLKVSLRNFAFSLKTWRTLCCKDQYVIFPVVTVTKHSTDFLELDHCLNVLLWENTRLRLAHLKIKYFHSSISYSKDGIGAPFMGSLAECEYACLWFLILFHTLICLIYE